MTDTRQPDFEPCTIQQKQAWERFRAMRPNTHGDRSVKKLWEELVQEGHKISYARLAQWAQEGKWKRRMAMAKPDLDPSEVIASMEQLAAEGKSSDPDALVGLRHRMIDRLKQAIENVVINTPAEAKEWIEAMALLDIEIHRGRAMGLGSGGANGFGDGNVIGLGEFKPRKA